MTELAELEFVQAVWAYNQFSVSFSFAAIMIGQDAVESVIHILYNYFSDNLKGRHLITFESWLRSDRR